MVFCNFVLPAPSVVHVRQFIFDYRQLKKLLCEEWNYDLHPSSSGPGVQMDFDLLESFVKSKLIELAGSIRYLEELKFTELKCRTNQIDIPQVTEEIKVLRKEFGRIFDTLKPFGLVYPTYDPYFEPNVMYLYG